jgi:hypothetical protein
VGTTRFSTNPRSGKEPGEQPGSLPTQGTAAPSVPTTPAPTPGVPIRPDLGPPGAGAQPVDQPGSGIGLIVAIIASAIVLVLAIYASGRAVPSATPVLPVFQTTNALFWIVAVVVVAGVGIGAQFAEQMAARGSGVARRAADALPTAWIVPTVSTAAAVLLVATFHNALMIAVGPVVAFLGNAGALLARDLLDDSADSAQRAAITVHSLVVLAVAFLALSVVYLNKPPTPAAVVLVAAIGFLLTLETLERAETTPPRRILYAAMGGFVLAQVAIPLNWWMTWGWIGGAVLLSVFYLTSGLLLAAARAEPMRPRDLAEFGLVSGAAFVILAIFA